MMNNATIRVIVNRESVHAGDDTDSHREIWDFPFEASLDDLLVNLCSQYLASVAGNIMWEVYLGGRKPPAPPQLLALIYVDYPSRLVRVTRVWHGDQALKGLRDLDGPQSELPIFVGYPSGHTRLRLATLDEIKQSPYYTGATAQRTPLGY
jgi:hypothetical protein